MASLKSAFGSAVAAMAFWALTIPSASAQAGPTFACDPGFYQVISGQLSEFDPAANAYRTIGSKYSNYNAMGHRIADGYVYALAGQSLFRIDANGGRTTLATLDIASGPYTGDFGDDGLLHASRGGRDWVTIDVETFEVTRRPDLSVQTAVADIANVHGVFYGVSSAGSLYRVDPQAGAVVEVGPVSGLPSTSKSYGAAWATAGGNLYVGRNSGEIYQITGYTTASPKATQVATAVSTNSNDGASCSLAAPPAGVADVDGPEPESTPSTPEAQQATETYQTVYQEPSFEVDDAGIGTGASCDPTVAEDRMARLADRSPIAVDVDTVLYQTGFDGSGLADFQILSGNWSDADGRFEQLNTCGFDYTALLSGHLVADFRWDVGFVADDGPNHAGVVVHQSDPLTRSGAVLVDFADGGSTVRWGEYDGAGYYRFLGSAPVAAAAPGTAVTLSVEARGPAITILVDGVVVGSTEVQASSGHVGLVANQSVVSFDAVTLTALAPGEQP